MVAAGVGMAAAFSGCGGGGGTNAGGGGSGGTGAGTTGSTSSTSATTSTTSGTTATGGTGTTSSSTTTTTGTGGATGLCTPGSTALCYDGASATENVGICKGGTKTCAADGQSYGACAGQVLPKTEDCATAEDDDCNGTANDGCACTPGEQKPCYSGPAATMGVGICKVGSQTCKSDASGFGPCVGEVLPAIENCQAAGDENCDGVAQTCTGATNWSKSFPDANAATAAAQTSRAVARTAEGGAVITGDTTGTVDFGNGPLASSTSPSVPTAQPDVFVAAYDGAGKALWSHVYGDAQSQVGRGVTVDPNGNIVLVGDFGGSISFGVGPMNSAGGNDVYVAKLDVVGNAMWSKRFGGTGNETGVSVATDPSGNIFFTGTFSGTMTLDPPCGAVAAKGASDLFVVKLDGAGACQWVRTFGVALQSQAARAIAVDQSGNVAITGQAIGAIDFGGGAHTYKGGGDIFVAKLNPTSNYLWSKLYGDASSQIGTDLAFDGGGNLFLVGDQAGTISFNGGNVTAVGGTPDVFLAKIGPTGTDLWAARFGDALPMASRGVSVDPLGNVVITGDMQGTADFVTFGTGSPLTAKGTDIFVAKFDGLGNAMWSKNYGDAAAQNSYAVAAGAGQVYLTGTFLSVLDFGNGPVLNNPSTTKADVFLVKLEP